MPRNQNKRVGLTGGIASGKSVVAQLFRILNVPVYDSDLRAKKLINENVDLKNMIIEGFGENSYHADGSYNVPYISSIVFQNKQKLIELNRIVHPFVFQDQDTWFHSLMSPYAIVESALIYETNTEKNFDEMIVVAADDSVRIERIMQRDELSYENACMRVANQMAQQIKIEKANYVIYNNGVESLITQVLGIHEELLGDRM